MNPNSSRLLPRENKVPGHGSAMENANLFAKDKMADHLQASTSSGCTICQDCIAADHHLTFSGTCCLGTFPIQAVVSLESASTCHLPQHNPLATCKCYDAGAVVSLIPFRPRMPSLTAGTRRQARAFLAVPHGRACLPPSPLVASVGSPHIPTKHCVLRLFDCCSIRTQLQNNPWTSGCDAAGGLDADLLQTSFEPRISGGSPRDFNLSPMLTGGGLDASNRRLTKLFSPRSF